MSRIKRITRNIEVSFTTKPEVDVNRGEIVTPVYPLFKNSRKTDTTYKLIFNPWQAKQMIQQLAKGLWQIENHIANQRAQAIKALEEGE
jgi:hypothetical protein